MSTNPNTATAASHSGGSVSSKIFLLVATFSLPIGVLAYLLASNYTPQIESAQQELMGNAVQRPLMKALNAVLSSQNVLQSCEAAGCASALAGKRPDIDSALAEAALQSGTHEGDLKTDGDSLSKAGKASVSPAALQTEWKTLTAGADAGNIAADRNALAGRYTHLAGSVSQLINYVGNTSNLILDPDLDSYYLVDVTLLAMPDTFSHTATATSLARKVLGGGGPVDRAALTNEVTFLRQSLDRITASNKTSFDADEANHGTSPTLKPALTAALQHYQAAMTPYLSTLEALGANPSQGQASTLDTQSAAVQQAGLDFWNSSVAELDTLLNTRISDFRSSRVQALGFSALAVAIAAFIAILIGRSITKPLDQLVRNLGPGATLLGVSVERIAEASRSKTPDPEEAAIICEELNAHADNMRTAVMELARHVQGSAAGQMVASATGQQG